jgi:hypothetical protein
MNKNIFTTVFALVITLISFSQENVSETKKGYKYNNNFDIALAAGNSQFSGAASWVHFHGIGNKKQKFKIGYGVRYTSYMAKNKAYVTAPAKITAGKTGPQVLFTEINLAKYDTINFQKSQHHAINISINLQYSFTQKLEVGFNIDAVGFTFGPKQTGSFVSSVRPASTPQQQAAKPTPLNALLISDNDIGTLNSELYARYWFSDKIAVRAGLSFLFTEYTSINKLTDNNNRWRNKSLMPMIGFTYTPFKN